ncbi:cysteine hydrolase family protein [Amnibacterium kyonggiense]|uniref:Nicotinamidase-related amidase n=1 Tax=Amnibacterium kyonggiense TaxID=595671 RepID=A0A4R7FQW7_9MICO|nr:cysteine hydrolase [Amnibacterium kyonggiense]TDS80192.1 nicotinamidase-related amidase [Amnibacterium kyonggiense]
MTGTRLVVVDMQRVFADAGSSWATPGYASASAGVRRLLPAFDGATVFTRFVAPAEPTGSWIPYYADWPDQLRPEDDPMWDITPELPVGDAPVVSAPTFGKWGPDLAAATEGADRLVVTGVSTDCCVLSTALAAADAGRFVVVPEDACAGLSDADHRRALDAMTLYAPLITISSVDAVLAMMGA